MEACVTRSNMLHGSIPGLYLFRCPDGRKDDSVPLADRMPKGGPRAWVYRTTAAGLNCWNACCGSGR